MPAQRRTTLGGKVAKGVVLTPICLFMALVLVLAYTAASLADTASVRGRSGGADQLIAEIHRSLLQPASFLALDSAESHDAVFSREELEEQLRYAHRDRF